MAIEISSLGNFDDLIDALSNAVYTYSHYEGVKKWHEKRGSTLKSKECFGRKVIAIWRMINGWSYLGGDELTEEDKKTLEKFEAVYGNMRREEVAYCIYRFANDEDTGMIRNVKFDEEE